MKLNKYNFSLNIPAIMGVCNVTLDSFSDGGKNYKTSEALTNIKKMYQCSFQNFLLIKINLNFLI